MSDSGTLEKTVARARRHAIGDLLARSVARHPQKTALVYGSLRQSYAELDASVDRAASALAARGIGSGDRVAMLSHNHHHFVVIHLALARLGAISVPINYMLQAGEVGFILGHAGVRGLVAEDALLAVAQAALAELAEPPTVLGLIPECGTPPPTDWESTSRWLAHDIDVLPELEASDDDPVQIMYTSGTESRPKGALLSARNLVAQYVSCIVDGEMRGDDIEVHALPLYHCAQMHCFLSVDLYLGATSIVLPGADAGRILETVARERATKLFCPPTVWISLLRHPDFDRTDLSSLKKGYYGASIMPKAVLEELAQRLPGVRLFNFYGQTELSPLATVLKPEDQLRKLGSAGRACLNMETRVVDDEDRPLPPGQVGEIVHRGPHIMIGYWQDPVKTAEAFRNGWFHSGDLGVFDEEGYLSVVDRKKDMIKTGGENVASREVEEAIYRHPAVAEVAVFGLPHPQWIESVTAVVVPRAGHALDGEELIAFCRSTLAGYKTPKRVHIAAALPKNASGKILKRELRDRYAEA